MKSLKHLGSILKFLICEMTNVYAMQHFVAN